MVRGVPTGGFAALLLVFAVVLAAAAVPMLSGHSPLEAAGPDSGPEIEGSDVDAEEFDAADVDEEFDSQDIDARDDVEADEGLIHEDFASLADDEDIAETMMGMAGLLAILFGGDGVEGAAGGPTTQDDAGEPTDQEETELLGDDPVPDEQNGLDEDVDADGSQDEAADGDAVDAAGDDSQAGDGEDSDETAEHEEETGEDEQADDELAAAEGDADDPDEESTDDETAGSDTEAGGEEPDSLLDRLDPLTIGLLVGGLVAVAGSWFAYRTGRGLVGIMLSIPTLIVGAVTRFVFGITAVVERALGAVRAASSVLAVPGLFVAAVVQSCRNFAASVGSLFDRGQPTVDASEVDQLPSEREQIRAAWRAVVDAVGSRRFRRRTPGEIKQRALDRGLAEQPVSTLVGVFRDVEYGAKDPTERAPTAVSAANELSEAADTANTTDGVDQPADTDESTDSSEDKQ